MRKSRFTGEQIVYCLGQAQAGGPVEELCRKHAISLNTFYRWRTKFGTRAPSEVRRMKHMEEELGRLKQIVADLTLDKQILQEALRRNV